MSERLWVARKHWGNLPLRAPTGHSVHSPTVGSEPRRKRTPLPDLQPGLTGWPLVAQTSTVVIVSATSAIAAIVLAATRAAPTTREVRAAPVPPLVQWI